ncbi:glutathione S-transferase family protein [Pseudomonas abietaniphila]|uniref:glutathione S-transferase family protein n=1 Tax=Pseudomonas abietaniphila TaxID=89065 RepID=UPI00321627A5
MIQRLKRDASNGPLRRLGDMVLYQFRMGTNPRRVSIYLSEKGIDVPRYELDYANLEHRTPEYLMINPAGRAPTLVTDDGTVITEAAAIVEYIEELFPQPAMIGTSPEQRAKVRALERIGNDLIARSMLWLWNTTDAFPRKEPKPSKAFAEMLYRHVQELLDVLELTIGENEFLAGDAPTIADCTVFPIFQTARERFKLPYAEHYPRLNAWYENFRTRKSAQY